MSPASRARAATQGATGVAAAMMAMLALTGALAAPVHSAEGAGPPRAMRDGDDAAPRGTSRQAAEVRAILRDINDRPFTDVNLRVTEISNPLLRAYLKAEAALAAPADAVDAESISAILTAAPDLPQRRAIEKLAQSRGLMIDAPRAPATRPRRNDPTPRRNPPKSSNEPAALALSPRVAALIKADDAVGAEALVRAALPDLSTGAATEWLHKAAWAHYIENRDGDALRVAREASARGGPWAVMASHVIGLIEWRAERYGPALAAFTVVARQGHDADLRAAGGYWASRAAQAAGRPAAVAPLLRAAAAEQDSFYGLIAREALGLALPPGGRGGAAGARVDPRFRDAVAALVAAGAETGASDWLRRRAASAGAQDHAAYRALAAQLNLPATQMQLAQALPVGAPPATDDRYPVPRWQPASGWTVDPSLVLAHAMQESGFRPQVISPAGATGLMQVRPGTAADLKRWGAVDDAEHRDLTDPEVSLSLGQAYLRRLAGSEATEGRLPKIVAAYNAGPAPVARWNQSIPAGNDPLLFIESIPYGETRQYVGTVLRNYWAYRNQTGSAAPSLVAIVQGQWSGLPTIGGDGPSDARRSPGRAR